MNKQNTAELRINTLPVPTWRHLKMNGCDLTVSYEESPQPLTLASLQHEGLLVSQLDTNTTSQDGSLSSFVQQKSNSSFRVVVEEGRNANSPLKLNYFLDAANPTVIDDLVVDMEPFSCATILQGYRTPIEGKATFHGGNLKAHVGSGASLTVIQLRFLNEGTTDLGYLDITVADGGKLEVVQIAIGSAQSYIGTHVELQGDGAECTVSCMNIVDRQGVTDLNVHIEHRGKRTLSTLVARGALLDEASKLFRGTLDFHQGCSQSKGSEDESSLLLSPKVKNRSIPLILCGEADVEGSHAVSSGKPDQDSLFYLMCRGIEERKARRMLVEAQLEPILGRVPDKKIQSEIRRQLARRLERDEQ